MKSAGNGDVVQSRLQVLHVHVFLVAPLGARHVAKPRADQHQGGVAIGECPYHSRPSADLTVQPLDHVVGADARPVLAGKIAVGQRFLNAVLDLLGGLLQLHGAQLGDHGFRLLAGRLFALLGVDRLEHFFHNFDLGFGHNRENVAISSCPSGISSVKLSRSASTARFIDRRHQIPCSGTSIFRLRSCWLRPLADCRETCTCCFLMQHLRAKRE